MFRPIERGARRALVNGSFIVALGAILVVPLAGSTSGFASGISPKSLKPEIVRRDDPWKNAMVEVTRDPFLPEPGPTKPPALPSQMAGTPDVVRASATDASVRGLAFGQEPKAVVEIGGSTRIVAPGDSIDGTRVTAILPDRILLYDGSVLMFSRKSP